MFHVTELSNLNEITCVPEKNGSSMNDLKSILFYCDLSKDFKNIIRRKSKKYIFEIHFSVDFCQELKGKVLGEIKLSSSDF